MPERNTQSAIMGYICAFTLAPAAPLLEDDPDDPEPAVLAASPLEVRVVCSPLAPTLGVAVAGLERPRLARFTPLAIVEVVTQFEDEGVL